MSAEGIFGNQNRTFLFVKKIINTRIIHILVGMNLNDVNNAFCGSFVEDSLYLYCKTIVAGS